jgi:hypothetical protein
LHPENGPLKALVGGLRLDREEQLEVVSRLLGRLAAVDFDVHEISQHAHRDVARRGRFEALRLGRGAGLFVGRARRLLFRVAFASLEDIKEHRLLRLGLRRPPADHEFAWQGRSVDPLDPEAAGHLDKKKHSA